jgi:hypothetical protein
MAVLSKADKQYSPKEHPRQPQFKMLTAVLVNPLSQQ